jgi:hypothetical protein
LKAIKPEQLVDISRKVYATPNVMKAEWLPEKK